MRQMELALGLHREVHLLAACKSTAQIVLVELDELELFWQAQFLHIIPHHLSGAIVVFAISLARQLLLMNQADAFSMFLRIRPLVENNERRRVRHSVLPEESAHLVAHVL